jgi:hypothetical protein
VLGALEKRGRLEIVRSPRSRPVAGAYPDGTILRFS